jgi:hypothetical protein
MNLAVIKLALLSFALMVSACAAVAAAPAAPLTLHEQDSGHTFSVHVGDTVKVDLLDTFPVPGSSVVWTADTSDAAVLSRLGSTRETPAGIANSQAHYVATFQAVKIGTVTIQIVGAAHCEAMNPAFCPAHTGSITIAVS